MAAVVGGMDPALCTALLDFFQETSGKVNLNIELIPPFFIQNGLIFTHLLRCKRPSGIV